MNHNQPKSSRKKLGTGLFVAALLVAGLIIPSRFALTMTPSTPYRLFFVGGKADDVKGKYILFERNLSAIGKGKAEKIIKHVPCSAGNNLKVRGMDYFCDGVWMGRAKSKSRTGIPVNPFVYDGQIPQGKLFVMGTHKDSYDSRYFGFLDVKEVKSVVYPIL